MVNSIKFCGFCHGVGYFVSDPDLDGFDAESDCEDCDGTGVELEERKKI